MAPLTKIRKRRQHKPDRSEVKATAKAFGMSEKNAETLIRRANAAGPRPDGTVIDT